MSGKGKRVIVRRLPWYSSVVQEIPMTWLRNGSVYIFVLVIRHDSVIDGLCWYLWTVGKRITFVSHHKVQLTEAHHVRIPRKTTVP